MSNSPRAAPIGTQSAEKKEEGQPLKPRKLTTTTL